MSALRWEWNLPDGHRVVATLDVEGGVESVLVDGQLVVRAPRASRPEGHRVDASGGHVVVAFEPYAPICVLRVDGDEVAPTGWPGRDTTSRGARPGSSAGATMRFVPALAGIALLVAGALGLRAWLAPRSESASLASHRAGNGLFVARFPTTFAARAAVAPPGANALLLDDRGHDAAVVIVAMPLGTMARDPWLVQKRLHAEALATLPRADGSYDETSRREETCLGDRGAVVVGRATTAYAAPAKIWSCALVREDAAFLLAYAVREDATPADEARVRGVVEATELTSLADVPVPSP